jgi:cell division protein FtsB
MVLKGFAFVLIALIVLIQYPLWLGKHGWFQVWDLNRQLGREQSQIEQLQLRNDALRAEVLDLREGLGAIEERARAELGMVKRDEMYFQLVPNLNPNRDIAPAK